MTSEPLWEWTQLRWFIDVHVIDRPEAADLRRLGELAWVSLQVTDTAYTEAMSAKDDTKREQLRVDLSPYPVAWGAIVLDHSFLDWSVTANDEDDQRLRKVYATLWPYHDFDADGRMDTSTGRTRFRDAMHVATAIRYDGTGFVTEDGGVLEAVDRVAERFDGFMIVTIVDATERSIKAAQHRRKAAAISGKPDPAILPDWPPATP